MARLFSRTDTSLFGQWWWTIDRMLLGAFLLLAVVGVMLVATASPSVAERIGLNEFHFLTRHIQMVGAALAGMIFVSFLPPRWIWRCAALGFVVAMIGMVLVVLIGPEYKGATRWLPVLGMSLQPSEFVKPALAIVVAWFLSRQEEDPVFPGFKIAFGLFSLVIMLLLMQPDIGMSAVITGAFVTQLVLAGIRLRFAALLGGLGLVGICISYFTFSHVRDRIDDFIFDRGDSYQVDLALSSFQAGGLFGLGPGQGELKLKLPDAHADFIFAVGAEEMGLIFVLFLVGLYSFIILRSLNRVIDSTNMFVILAVGGLAVMIGLQALVHMGSSVGLLPAKGMTLPLASYGGTSALAVGGAFGCILALTRRNVLSQVKKGVTGHKIRQVYAS